MKTLHHVSERSARYLFVFILASFIMLLQSCNGISKQAEKTPYINSLSITPTSSKTSSTATLVRITPVSDNKNQTPTSTNLDTIYVWGPPFYGYLPYWDTNHNMIAAIPSNYQVSSKYIVYPAFSPFSGEVALLVENKDEWLELWVANVDLSNARLLWTDTGNSFGYSYRHPEDQIFDILWGPGGKFVLVSMNDLGRSKPFQKNIVIDVQSQAFWETADKCNHYLLSEEKSSTISLSCKLISGEYLILDANGEYRKSATLLASQNIRTEKWSISPNSERILYATEQDDIFVQSKDSSLKLHIKLGIMTDYDDLEPLQWSRNGSRLLIWSEGVDCQHGQQAPCWKVIDAQTGKLLWAEDTITYATATLSPDGKRLIRFISGTFMDRKGVITDIATNTSEFIIDSTFSKVAWIK